LITATGGAGPRTGRRYDRLYDAISRALDHLELGASDRRALLVVSDGGDNASARTLGEIVAQARRANAAVYSIILSDSDNGEAKPQVLKKLAEETGGEAFKPEHGQEVSSAFAQIAREIRSGYLLGFSPRTPPTVRELDLSWRSERRKQVGGSGDRAIPVSLQRTCGRRRRAASGRSAAVSELRRRLRWRHLNGGV
jgi:VWFA-related protein